MTVVSPRKRHDDSSALGTENIWDDEQPTSPPRHEDLSRENRLPAEGKILPIVVYLATDFRSQGPLDNGDISLLGMIQTASEAGIRVCRWEPDPRNLLEGRVVMTEPLNRSAPERVVEREAVRNWPGGVSLVARWPGNEAIVDAAAIVFTGPHGNPRVVRDASNIAVHREERIAGYGSGIDFVAHRATWTRQAFHVISEQQAADVKRATGATDISVGGARRIADVRGK